MSVLKRIVSSSVFMEAASLVGTWYLRFAWATSSQQLEPPDIYDTFKIPAILSMWHGQHFMLPFVKRPEHKAKVLISRHRDGEVNARAAERLGVGTVRGSGAHNGEFTRKGGASAFAEMLDALKDGYNMALTADVPKVSRVCGLGVIKLAQYSGRPIYPVAVASSRRIELDNWDHTAINLPFSRMGLVAGDAIYVARDADVDALEAARLQVENELNRVTKRAYDIADRKGSAAK